MGHKVHPKIYRTPVIYNWDSRWFAKKNYAKFSEQDTAIREYIAKKCKNALIDGISVERGPKNITITILAAKPGFVIGRSGKDLDTMRKHIETKILQMKLRAKINVREVRSPATSAPVIAQSIAADIERRMPFRRVMKQTVQKVMTAGAKGVKVILAGRLNGVEIARTETVSDGKVPLITIRSNIDYSTCVARTIYGAIGIKVWVYHGETFAKNDKFEQAEKDQVKRPRRNIKKF
ncbi:MAG: 30S ribosomal protein S3 [Candidatus Magasanikbacteria bacterium]|jgi:small subunit ribosomal protein S3|nr:30S ribosomal protein S3 [Candidatus Magasanikbacteria bacterium]MBT5262655.1 30S ribosomal protein S3 [Candidatus Magasanikbacteria bacterium]MBT5820276.1 30S ribosomal protein S3 [Candidatus Magasanikbacteria bacterium]MBT6294539.1 30S ribosomal protein S3 [Candidatus Magasanikbacteria bacterium]